MQLKIQAKLIAIVLVFVAGSVMYATTVHYTTHTNLEQSDYRDVMLMKDLLADVVPPTLYAVEARVTLRKASRESNKTELVRMHASWNQRRVEFLSRIAFWSEHLPAGALRTALVERNKREAERLFAIGDNEVWPAIDAGDAARVKRGMDALEEAFTAHRSAVDEVVLLTNQQIERNVQSAASTIGQRKTALNGLALAIVVLGAAVALTIARSLLQRTRGVVQTLSRVTQGDLSVRAEVEGTDELAEMASMLNQSLAAIERAFADVRQVAVSLSDSASRLASNSDEIAQGAQQQAASLEQTAASLEEITATIKQSADSAQEANVVAVGSREVAERGGAVVHGAIAAMDEVSKSSRRIEDIIVTIDEIALQTNLLALNAAVEAARAGEQGRGFAVVAAEVGNLAQRSAGAAKEVKTLIQQSLTRIQSSHALVGQSGSALDDILRSAKKVTQIVGGIASAAQEQSLGVSQVNQAVSQMDHVTQNSASQTQQLSYTAQELAENARQLERLVARFRLNDDAQLRAAANDQQQDDANRHKRLAS